MTQFTLTSEIIAQLRPQVEALIAGLSEERVFKELQSAGMTPRQTSRLRSIGLYHEISLNAGSLGGASLLSGTVTIAVVADRLNKESYRIYITGEGAAGPVAKLPYLLPASFGVLGYTGSFDDYGGVFVGFQASAGNAVQYAIGVDFDGFGEHAVAIGYVNELKSQLIASYTEDVTEIFKSKNYVEVYPSVSEAARDTAETISFEIDAEDETVSVSKAIERALTIQAPRQPNAATPGGDPLPGHAKGDRDGGERDLRKLEGLGKQPFSELYDSGAIELTPRQLFMLSLFSPNSFNDMVTPPTRSDDRQGAPRAPAQPLFEDATGDRITEMKPARAIDTPPEVTRPAALKRQQWIDLEPDPDPDPIDDAIDPPGFLRGFREGRIAPKPKAAAKPAMRGPAAATIELAARKGGGATPPNAMGGPQAQTPPPALAAPVTPAIAASPSAGRFAAEQAVGAKNLAKAVEHLRRREGEAARSALDEILDGRDEKQARDAAFRATTAWRRDRVRGDDEETDAAIRKIPRKLGATEEISGVMRRRNKRGQRFYDRSERFRGAVRDAIWLGASDAAARSRHRFS